VTTKSRGLRATDGVRAPLSRRGTGRLAKRFVDLPTETACLKALVTRAQSEYHPAQRLRRLHQASQCSSSSPEWANFFCISDLSREVGASEASSLFQIGLSATRAIVG